MNYKKYAYRVFFASPSTDRQTNTRTTSLKTERKQNIVNQHEINEEIRLKIYIYLYKTQTTKQINKNKYVILISSEQTRQPFHISRDRLSGCYALQSTSMAFPTPHSLEITHSVLLFPFPALCHSLSRN